MQGQNQHFIWYSYDELARMLVVAVCQGHVVSGRFIDKSVVIIGMFCQCYYLYRAVWSVSCASA